MFASSLIAEAAFYEAFGAGDLAAMMQVWEPAADAVCIHPSGPRLEGIAAIRQSWALILERSIPRNFELRGRVIVGETELRIHMLEENITVPGSAFVAPPVLATNVYRRSADGWRLLVHHASVAPAGIESTEPPHQPGTPTGRLH